VKSLTRAGHGSDAAFDLRKGMSMSGPLLLFPTFFFLNVSPSHSGYFIDSIFVAGLRAGTFSLAFRCGRLPPFPFFRLRPSVKSFGLRASRLFSRTLQDDTIFCFVSFMLALVSAEKIIGAPFFLFSQSTYGG